MQAGLYKKLASASFKQCIPACAPDLCWFSAPFRNVALVKYFLNQFIDGFFALKSNVAVKNKKLVILRNIPPIAKKAFHHHSPKADGLINSAILHYRKTNIFPWPLSLSNRFPSFYAVFSPLQQLPPFKINLPSFHQRSGNEKRSDFLSLLIVLGNRSMVD